ncbi:Fur family transcriptional regulator [Pararhodobacter oceanensis]|uniref:Ferric uptake regulation protein n=1 Tax=Pararhodobacter oceanensis TaxID=2172121 RepID=A0A2T8HT44_9RHOB|nr:Fur family transcriptional regulator [Pararhodobacter oceanensis]PVH28563.1 transcriptional repressor [Pararhodobacter oceanensis]
MTKTETSQGLVARCEAKGLRLTGQRRIIAGILETAEDHPDVEELHRRAVDLDPRISIATVYRTVKAFEDVGLLERREFGDGRARWEDADREHHDHLIDLANGDVIEFCDPEIEALKEAIARKLGYRLEGHRLELYGVKLES